MTSPTPRPPRRPQAERSADTRSKLIEAAIACLHRTGYSTTTVSTVAAEAGVSRGAMTHQFPAKTDLMIAVVEHVFEQDSTFYARTIEAMDPGAFLLGLPEMMWGVISRPAGIAVIEIMLASRSDPGLAERLRELQSAIDVRAHKWSGERVRAAGIKPHPDGEAIHELYVAAVRGLAIEATFMNNSDGVHRALRVLSDMMRRFYPDLTDPPAIPETKSKT
ncbi:TetR/AcrR family transcriptional regulator [Sphingomonas sp. Leaf357]|uniref:TetR/AcrR family transcriptional regulator n=1 Tax=Sphingomonas sp. Leaf357 TaxID=1736350 RepID=UPI0012E24A23|nr:TetR/AcrR family transcriptional regulator [Sphingomonas sp. Leaf357]